MNAKEILSEIYDERFITRKVYASQPTNVWLTYCLIIWQKKKKVKSHLFHRFLHLASTRYHQMVVNQ